MKKSLKGLIAVTASVISTGAIASNLENPLYMPQNREVYLKTGAGVMYKRLDATEALKNKGQEHSVEVPVWRFTGDLGYGITDNLDVHGRFGYTKDGKIDRKGMYRGRIGLTYRVLEESDPFILDFYADGFLSGISPMKGTLKRIGANNVFDFDNYSNGRWGIIGGTRFGKTWNDFTLAAHAEYLQTFGNHNNKIAIDPSTGLTSTPFSFPDEVSVDLKSTNEICAGFDAFYQIDEKWSFGMGFEYYGHADNGVKSIHTDISDLGGNSLAKAKLLADTKDMNDGWDEYTVKASVGNQITDDIQIAMYAEYTFDHSHEQSQNGTDIKAELGVRLNARF